MSQGTKCLGALCIGGHFVLGGLLYRAHFVSGAFLLGGYLTGRVMVRWLLSGGFLPGAFDLEPSNINVLGFSDDLVLVAPTAQAL